MVKLIKASGIGLKLHLAGGHWGPRVCTQPSFGAPIYTDHINMILTTDVTDVGFVFPCV